ncbi:MAG: hypothetical protein GX565_17605 [Lentisphaerae bacterium]|nr:hypothetical protein [Lentisphaerota bacterium]
MAVIYSIQIIGGATAAVACRDLTVRRVTGGVSTCTFFVPGPADAAPAWPYGTEVAVLRSGVAAGSERLFRGSVTATRHVADGTSEGVAYTVSDAWWHLEKEIYKGGRTVIAEGASAPGTEQTPRILLFRTMDGTTRVSAAAAAGSGLAYAAAMGVPVQAGVIVAPVEPPADEVTDRTCAEIIQRALRWQPDAVAWIDHSTEPPTLSITRRADMTAATLPFAGEQVSIAPRHDLAVPGVEITFEYSGQRGRYIARRTAGGTSALGCARMTVTLDHEAGVPGPVQEVRVVALGDYTSLSWWRTLFPWLPESADITEPSISPVVPEGYVNVLVAGQIQQWMRDDYEVDAGRFTITCKAGFTVDGKTFTEKALTRSFTLTNAATKRYKGRSSAGWREPIPESLAADFYAAASPVQYEGSITLIEKECSAGRALMGKVLNVTGGRAEWAAMNAAVVSVTEEFDTGKTVIAFGPQNHLGPQDMVELIRASRMRTKFSIQSLDGDDYGEDDDVNPFEPEQSLAESPGQLSRLDIIDPEI